MNIINNFIIIGSLVTAACVIFGLLLKIYKFIRKWEKWVEETAEHSRDNYMSVLQLKIMAPYMPLTERVKAGDRYVELGGNGEVKRKYNQLINRLPTETEG